ncbi:hypothetical protein R6Q59_002286 [Mikania micrantha]
MKEAVYGRRHLAAVTPATAGCSNSPDPHSQPFFPGNPFLSPVRLTGLKIWRLIQPCGVAGEALKKKKKRRDGKRTILPSHVT